MARQNKQEVILTASGHQVDKDLLRVPIKVTPSLQALLEIGRASCRERV